MAPVIGIDLGTTNSCAAVVEEGKPLVIPIHAGKVTLPSVVAFVDGQRLVGEAAKRQSVSNVENTVYAAKRLMGRHFEDPHTKRAISTVTYECVGGPNGDVWVMIDGRKRAIQEISAAILSEIKEACVRHLARDVTEVVIAVPAYFNDRQRHATRQAAKIAGLEVTRVINEPTAAALAFGLHKGAERRVAAYDLGGGTFDVSVLRVGAGAIEVLASDGDAFLGGHDFDHRVFNWLVEEVSNRCGVDVTGDVGVSHRLWEAAEAAKIRLSEVDSTDVALPFLATSPEGEVIHYEGRLDRATYEGLVGDLVEKTLEVFADTVREAGLRPSDIDEVLLVGGMTRMPAIRQRVREITSCEPAAGVHPDLVVAVGAAVQAAMLSDETVPAALLDVTPHNLGVLTVAGLAETMIPKNTRVPAEQVKCFTTVRDDQDSVRIVVYQGDSRSIDKNEVLGEFHLEGLRPAPRGQVKIDVRFAISTEGDVHATATDTETGQAQEIRIEGAIGLDDAQMADLISGAASP